MEQPRLVRCSSYLRVFSQPAIGSCPVQQLLTPSQEGAFHLLNCPILTSVMLQAELLIMETAVSLCQAPVLLTELWMEKDGSHFTHCSLQTSKLPLWGKQSQDYQPVSLNQRLNAAFKSLFNSLRAAFHYRKIRILWRRCLHLPTHLGWVGQWCRAERHQQGAVISQKEMLEQSCFSVRDQRGWISKKHQQQFRFFISLPLKSWQRVLTEKINPGLSHFVPGFIANEGKLWELQCSDSVNYSLPDLYQPCIKKQPQIWHTTFVWNSISTLLFPWPTKIT